MLKGVMGAFATALLAMALDEPLPRLTSALGLLAVGATGYGLSLRFYLLAQRAFGAARLVARVQRHKTARQQRVQQRRTPPP